MALPLVPIVIGAGLLGTSGFITGAATSDTLGTGLSLASLVVGLVLVMILIQRFGLLRS